MSDYEVSDTSRLDRLEARQAHMEADMSGVATKVDVLIEALKRIEDAAYNKQPIWNINTILTLLVVAGGLILSMVTYMHTLINPILESQQLYDQFRYEMHYEVGVMKENFSQADRNFATMTTITDKVTDQILSLTRHAAASDARQEMLFDQLNKIDTLGSRKWIEAEVE